MSRPRYQRDGGGSPQQNGMNDGWMRPVGPTPPPATNERPGAQGIRNRGIAENSRYLVAWVVPSLNLRKDLRCNFDVLTDALGHVADHPETACGGIWDTRGQKWVL